MTVAAARTTVVVVTWNSAPDLTKCLQSLPSGVDVIVVDNASTDDSAELAGGLGAYVIRRPSNDGFAVAVNAALEHVETEFVLLLNPDVVTGPGSIERCARELATDPSIGIVGPATILPDGRPEPPAARHDRSLAQIAIETTGLVHLSRRFDRQMIHERTLDLDVDAINGAFLMTRTALLRSLGGLDESVFMYLEDQDLCRRVRDAGLRVRFLSSAHATHGNGTSTARGDEAQQVRAYLNRIDADVEFLRRYGRPGEAQLAAVVFAVRCAVGLLIGGITGSRLARYRAAFSFSLKQIGRRHAAPPV